MQEKQLSGFPRPVYSFDDKELAWVSRVTLVLLCGCNWLDWKKNFKRTDALVRTDIHSAFSGCNARLVLPYCACCRPLSSGKWFIQSDRRNHIAVTIESTCSESVHLEYRYPPQITSGRGPCMNVGSGLRKDQKRRVSDDFRERAVPRRLLLQLQTANSAS